MSKRPLSNRILDRAWSSIGSLLENPEPPPDIALHDEGTGSVSGTLSWPNACRALVQGEWSTRGFRRTRAVRQVVETLGLTDGRYFSRYIMRHHAAWLIDTNVGKVNDWGNPIQAPAWTLGTSRSFSPTSLRYLAHALWLKQEGYIKPGGLIAEIGVGFGGLAAMNALVTQARTTCIDLPEVERTASLMMEQNGLSTYIASRDELARNFCLISNYAFTELSESLQDLYFDQLILKSNCGMIVSNAGIFAQGIGGRNDKDLVSWFRSAGLDARAHSDCPILGPSDRMLGNKVITWSNP